MSSVVKMTAWSDSTSDYQNQDDYFMVLNEAAGVFDGVGGSMHGEIASKACAQFCLASVANNDLGVGSPDEILRGSREFVRAKTASGLTTAALAGFVGNKAYIAWAGDSRVYKLMKGKEMICLTLDHALSEAEKDPQEARRQQYVLSIVEADNQFPFPRDSFAFMRRNIITSSIGGSRANPGKIDTVETNLEEGDIILLTTDGVHDNLTHDEIAGIVSEPGDRAKRLVDAAGARSFTDHFRAKKDDITAVVCEYGKG